VPDEVVARVSENARLSAKDVLSSPTGFPNDVAGQRLERLVGLDAHVSALVRDLPLIFDPELAEDWSTKHYGKAIPGLALLRDAVPLIIFEGDVGTGKTELAETIGHRIAKDGGYGVHLVKMSTRVRGTGYVGEMGTLLADSFKHVVNLWKKLGEPILFVIDEADSLLTSRESAQHHHEDKSGVNTILQHLDGLRADKAQVAVIAITNRIGVLDPAVLRRATSVLTFRRPTPEQRADLFSRLFDGTGLGEPGLQRLVEASAERPIEGATEPIAFSYSDLTLRFAVPALRAAIHAGEPLSVDTLIATLQNLEPTRPLA
jgi:SpoVK/Ycf46/Vps4 family AAA+-type ATPase